MWGLIKWVHPVSPVRESEGFVLRPECSNDSWGKLKADGDIIGPAPALVWLSLWAYLTVTHTLLYRGFQLRGNLSVQTTFYKKRER